MLSEQLGVWFAEIRMFLDGIESCERNLNMMEFKSMIHIPSSVWLEGNGMEWNSISFHPFVYSVWFVNLSKDMECI